MYYAVSQTNKNMIKLLLDNSFDLKREPSLLSYAIENSDEGIVRYLIDNGADINYKNANGTTVLYNSVLSLNPALVDYFLSKGAKIEEAGESDQYGNIIMAAAGSKFNNTSSSPVDLILLSKSSTNSAKIMGNIISNANKTTINRLVNGKNALIIAAGNSYIDTVKVLLTNGADVNSADNDGWTSLMYAANNGHLEIVKLLIDSGANVNAKDDGNVTALMLASKYGHLEIVKYLIDKGADVNAKNDNNVTVLAYASANGYLEVVKYLVEKGVDINLKDNDGKTSLDYALDNGHSEVAQFLKSKGAI